MALCLSRNVKLSLGGPEIKFWDLLAGGRLLTVMSPHNKTVTSLGLASRGTRLVTSSLDRQVKFHNISTFKTVHSVSFPSPVLTVAVSVSIVILPSSLIFRSFSSVLLYGGFVIKIGKSFQVLIQNFIFLQNWISYF